MNRGYGLHGNLRTAHCRFGDMPGSHCFISQLMGQYALVGDLRRGDRLLDNLCGTHSSLCQLHKRNAAVGQMTTEYLPIRDVPAGHTFRAQMHASYSFLPELSRTYCPFCQMRTLYHTGLKLLLANQPGGKLLPPNRPRRQMLCLDDIVAKVTPSLRAATLATMSLSNS